MAGEVGFARPLIIKEDSMQDPVDILKAAKVSAGLARDLQNQWSQFEKDFFEALLSIHFRPLVAKIESENTTYTFLIDYANQRLKEMPEHELICDVSRVAEFGNVIADSGKQETDDDKRNDSK